MHAALFYLPGDVLSLPELISARLDGLVSEIGEGYMPADITEADDSRATAIAALLPQGYAASGPTAAWILGAGDDPPVRHHAQRVHSRRARVQPGQRLIVHESRVAAGDLVSFDGVWVTTARRALLDLALGADRYPEYRAWGRALHQMRPTLSAAVRVTLDDLERVPGKLTAYALLDEWDGAAPDQDEVTRYTS